MQIRNLPTKDLELHLNLEKYLFKNVIYFTTEKIYYTCSKDCVNEDYCFPSYVSDIINLLDNSFKFSSNNLLEDKENTKYIENISKIYVNSKQTYTLKELVTFQLCPKMYYHLYIQKYLLSYTSKNQLRLYAEAIMYSDCLARFMSYNYENKKWYYANSNEVEKVINKILDETGKNNLIYFNFLSIPEALQITKRVRSRILHIINDYIIDKLNYKKYTIVKSKAKKYTCNNFDVLMEYDTAIFSDQKNSRKIDQNNIYIDFLTLKSTPIEIKEKHYKKMKQLLNSQSRLIDRIFFVNRMISKINVQFDSGIERFIHGNDGALERVNDLHKDIISADFSKDISKPSNFCDYCILNSICMRGKETQKPLEVIE